MVQNSFTFSLGLQPIHAVNIRLSKKVLRYAVNAVELHLKQYLCWFGCVGDCVLYNDAVSIHLNDIKCRSLFINSDDQYLMFFDIGSCLRLKLIWINVARDLGKLVLSADLSKIWLLTSWVLSEADPFYFNLPLKWGTLNSF